MTEPEPPPGITASELSQTERNILALLAFGQDRKSITRVLNTSPSTVSRALRGLRGFLTCRNSAYLVIRAVELDLIGTIDHPRILTHPGAQEYKRVLGILSEESKRLEPFEAAYLANAVPHHSLSLRNQWVSREPVAAAKHLFDRLRIDAHAAPDDFLLVLAVAMRLHQVEVVQEPLYQDVIEVVPGVWLRATGIAGSMVTLKHRNRELFFRVPDDEAGENPSADDPS